MNSADVFSLEFDMLTRTSLLAKILERFRATEIGAGTHRQLLLELNHVINVHSRLREVASDVVPPEDWSSWRELLAVPSLAFEPGRSFLDDLRALGLVDHTVVGAWLVFLRAIAPGESRGVLHVHPPVALLDALDALFAKGATAV